MFRFLAAFFVFTSVAFADFASSVRVTRAADDKTLLPGIGRHLAAEVDSK